MDAAATRPINLFEDFIVPVVEAQARAYRAGLGLAPVAADHPLDGPACLGRLAARADHALDEDCDVDPHTGCCRGCGVEHGAPCPGCGGRGYHQGPCRC